jgi:hypothetical protein
VGVYNNPRFCLPPPPRSPTRPRPHRLHNHLFTYLIKGLTLSTMGTRHLICVFYKDRFVVAQYGSCDGYPEGQGATLLNSCKSQPTSNDLRMDLSTPISHAT